MCFPLCSSYIYSVPSCPPFQVSVFSVSCLSTYSTTSGLASPAPSPLSKRLATWIVLLLPLALLSASRTALPQALVPQLASWTIFPCSRPPEMFWPEILCCQHPGRPPELLCYKLSCCWPLELLCFALMCCQTPRRALWTVSGVPVPFVNFLFWTIALRCKAWLQVKNGLGGLKAWLTDINILNSASVKAIVFEMLL